MKLYAEYINNFDAASQRLKVLLAQPDSFQFFQVSESVVLINLNLLMLCFDRIVKLNHVPNSTCMSHFTSISSLYTNATSSNSLLIMPVQRVPRYELLLRVTSS